MRLPRCVPPTSTARTPGQAAQRYATDDPIEIGEAAAREYLRLVNQAG